MREMSCFYWHFCHKNHNFNLSVSYIILLFYLVLFLDCFLPINVDIYLIHHVLCFVYNMLSVKQPTVSSKGRMCVCACVYFVPDRYLQSVN